MSRRNRRGGTMATQSRSRPAVHRWTQAEYHQMHDLGWFTDRRVELIDGEVIVMPVPRNAHLVAIALTRDALQAAFGPGHWVRVQIPLDLTPMSVPLRGAALRRG